MRARLELVFPLVLAAVLPLAGLLLALVRYADKRNAEGSYVLAAALLGAVVWGVVLTKS